MEQLDIEKIVQLISPVKITLFYPKAGCPQLALSGACYCIWTCDPHAHSFWDYKQPKDTWKPHTCACKDWCHHRVDSNHALF